MWLNLARHYHKIKETVTRNVYNIQIQQQFSLLTTRYNRLYFTYAKDSKFVATIFARLKIRQMQSCKRGNYLPENGCNRTQDAFFYNEKDRKACNFTSSL